MKNQWMNMIDQFLELQTKAFAHQDYNSWNHVRGQAPFVNLYQNGDQLELTAELPGVKKTDLSLEVKDDQLHLVGKRVKATTEEERLIHRERGGGDFDRWIQLPFKVDSAQVEAKYEDGLLQITLEKAQDEKAQNININ